MCQAAAAQGTNPSKTLGTEPLTSFPGRQHFHVLLHLIAEAVKCVLKFVPGFPWILLCIILL